MAEALGRSEIATRLEANREEEEAALQKLNGSADGLDKNALMAEEDVKG